MPRRAGRLGRSGERGDPGAQQRILRLGACGDTLGTARVPEAAVDGGPAHGGCWRWEPPPAAPRGPGRSRSTAGFCA